MVAVEAQLEQLSREVSTLQHEVAGLQVEAAKQARKWYQTPSVLVSVLALLFSFGTTALSYARIQEQDFQNRRAELRSILQRIHVIPVERLEKEIAFRTDQELPSMLSQMRGEEQFLVMQARDIATSILDRLSMAELTSLAISLFQASEPAESQRFIEAALARIDDAPKGKVNTDDEITARRLYADLLFTQGSGDLEPSLEQLDKAVEAARNLTWGEESPSAHQSQHVTLMQRASLLLAAEKCEEAQSSFERARAHLDGLPDDYRRDSYLREASRFADAMSAECQTAPRSNVQ